jgi:molecular chaperone GrpE (heat shock protein)
VGHEEIKVEDKRFWARKGRPEAEDEPSAETPEEPTAPAIDPAEFEAVRVRAEGAERKLQEIQAAFLAAKTDLDRARERVIRDAERSIELKFGDLVAGLLDSVDDLDRALEHGDAAAGAGPLLQGVAIARERFLAALQKAGVERLDPQGDAYDPNVAEAVGVVPVDDPERHDTVVTVVQAGYALAGRIIRPARVLVGRLVS